MRKQLTVLAVLSREPKRADAGVGVPVVVAHASVGAGIFEATNALRILGTFALADVGRIHKTGPHVCYAQLSLVHVNLGNQMTGLVKYGIMQ